jgi:protocatechuate 3,4-dioxygenase beta subunit
MKHFLLCFFLLLQLSLPAQDRSAQLKLVEQKLAGGKTTISDILGDTSFLQLHSLTPFREIIKKYAKAGKIIIAPANEPGARITVNVRVIDERSNPQSNVLVYVYHTSNKGWYSDTAAHIQMNEGDRRHARLFGYIRTNNEGRFELETIKPVGYPQSTLPAHIHIEVSTGEGKSMISELLFDDDPRLVGDTRKRAIDEGFIISKNTGTVKRPMYSYTVRLN